MMILEFCHYHIIQIDERTFLLFCLWRKSNPNYQTQFFLTLIFCFLDKIITVFNGLSKDEMKENEVIQ